MATNPVQVPQLTFLNAAQSIDDMPKDEFQAFFDVWIDTGSSLADAFIIAQRNAESGIGTDGIDWLLKANELDRELQRMRTLISELRSNKAIIQPPTSDTVDKVDKVTQAVGALQLAHAKGQAALSAITAALDIAQQVQGAKKPAPQAAASPAPAAG